MLQSILKDAKQFLSDNKKSYDVIIIDFPDPVELYTTKVFKDVSKALKKGGMIV